MSRWPPLGAWAATVAALWAWFHWTDYWPTDRWIVLAILVTMVAMAGVMLTGTAVWSAAGLGLLSICLGVAGLMRLLAASQFGWMPAFQAWELDLARAFLTVAAALLFPAAVRWSWNRRPWFVDPTGDD